MEHGRLIVDEALHVDVERLGDFIERLDVDGDGAVFVFGERGLALIDHGRELLNRIAAALAILLDALADVVGERTHPIHPLETFSDTNHTKHSAGSQ